MSMGSPPSRVQLCILLLVVRGWLVFGKLYKDCIKCYLNFFLKQFCFVKEKSLHSASLKIVQS